jgi:hypothetical protein
LLPLDLDFRDVPLEAIPVNGALMNSLERRKQQNPFASERVRKRNKYDAAILMLPKLKLLACPLVADCDSLARITNK